MAKKITNKEFQRQLAEAVAQLALTIESDVTAFKPEAGERRLRVERSRKDYEFFCRTYLPHYFQYEFSNTHREFEKIQTEIVNTPDGDTYAIAAPRGEGKSTNWSLAFILWCDVFDYKYYPIITMDTYEQAAIQLASLKAEYELNPRLKMDFPEYMGGGPVWREGVIVTSSGKRVDALGRGMKIRGRKHRAKRPDLVILDDLENDENVQKPEQRDKTERWIDRAVLFCGDAVGSLDVVYIGTVLHYDSVLNRKLESPDWVTRRFKSIIHWPENMRLWDRWEEILLSQGKQAALKFFNTNKGAMEKGAEVSWPGVRTLYKLMVIRSKGHSAFDAEQQNEPLNDDDAPFKELHYWVEILSQWINVGAVDPSLGKGSKKGDPSAIIIGAFDPYNVRLHILEADIRRRVPNVIISDVARYQREYDVWMWCCETNQFQEFFMERLTDDLLTGGVLINMEGVNHSVDKALRILSMQPHTQSGRIQFSRDHSTLLRQLRYFPMADHDDGPDAVEMLWRFAVSRVHRTQGSGGIVLPTRRRHRLNMQAYHD